MGVISMIFAKPLGNKQVKVFLKTTTAEQNFRGLLVMAELDGGRGHGYFIPAETARSW